MVMCCVFLQDGNTPLHDASVWGHVAVVEVLLKNGAAINQTNKVIWHIIDLLFHLHSQQLLSTHAYSFYYKTHMYV